MLASTSITSDSGAHCGGKLCAPYRIGEPCQLDFICRISGCESTRRSVRVDNSSIWLTGTETEPQRAEVSTAGCGIISNLRSAEKVILFYFVYLALEAIIFPVTFAGRVT